MKLAMFVSDEMSKGLLLSWLIEPIIVHLPFMSRRNILLHVKTSIFAIYDKERGELHGWGQMKRMAVAHRFKKRSLKHMRTLDGTELWESVINMYLAGVGLNKLPNFGESSVQGSSHMTKRKRG